MLPPHACETLRRGVVVTAGAGRGEGGDDHLDRSAATQRFAFAGLLTRYGLKRVRRALAAPFLWLVIRPAGPPIRLVIAPQDIRTADPVVASEIYSGLFVLGGKVVDAHGRSPFDLPPPSRAWAEALHGFGWLRHMRAADTSLARANAQALVRDWMVHARRGAPPLAAAPVVMARRLLSLLSQSPVVLDGADGRFYGRLMRSMAREGIALQRRLGAGLDGDARFWAALAVAEVGLCAENGAPYRRGGRLFLEELGRQVLADGGPASRDPSTLVDLLLDLLPLRQAYAARGSAVPPALLNAIDRMIPMLRMLRHGDGTLALFNGMGVTEADAIATILAYDDSRAMPLANAPYSGYQRLEAGPGILICDTGVAPTPEFATRAHAAPLAFEFSTGAQRIIVNCGRPASPGPAALAARSTAAHSTLVLADRSAGCFFEAPAFASALDGALLQGAATVPVSRGTDDGANWVAASHDGYARDFGLSHRRRLTLSRDGLRLEGEDSLDAVGDAAPAAVPGALRFHLHPAIRPVSLEDGGVMLGLPNGEEWLFTSPGFPATLEASILFADAGGPRHTSQIVVALDARPAMTVSWSLTRHY